MANMNINKKKKSNFRQLNEMGQLSRKLISKGSERAGAYMELAMRESVARIANAVSKNNIVNQSQIQGIRTNERLANKGLDLQEKMINTTPTPTQAFFTSFAPQVVKGIGRGVED